MSLVVAVTTAEGIVLASDSRASLSTTAQGEDGPERRLGVGVLDSNYKTFLAPHDLGIATFGGGGVDRKPIAGYIERFVAERIGAERPTVEAVARELCAWFTALDDTPQAHFYVVGYDFGPAGPLPQVWHVRLASEEVELNMDPAKPGAVWGGETDVLARVMREAYAREGEEYRPLPHHPVPYNYWTLQEAIDFAVYAIRLTADTMRFQLRPTTVGGPIDVLVVKPSGAFWVARKELGVRP